jgi:hypothetical protein
MPKTAIHENSNTMLGKDKVRLAEYASSAPPARNAEAAEQCYQRYLCGFVALAADE